MKFFNLLFILFLSSPVIAGQVSSRVNLSEGTLDDNFVLSIEVEGSAVSRPQVPADYQGVVFQAMGTSSSYSNINGVTKNTTTYNYQLSFEKAGTYTVPSIFTKIDSKLEKTLPIKLKVLLPSNAIADKSGKQHPPMYIERSFDKKEVYIGDYIVSKVKIYTRIPLHTTGYEYVDTPGFQIKEIKGARSSSRVIKGHTYKIFEITAILTLSKVGAFTVKPYKLTVSIPQKQRRRNRKDPFDDFFDDRMMQDFFGRRRSQKVISSNRINVKVLDLPKANQPSDFSGVIGDLQVSVKPPTGKLITGENVNLDVELFGDIRLDGVTLDGVKLNPSFKVYPSEGSGEDEYHHGGIRGKKLFSYGIVPTKPGKLDMGTVEVSYFDPKSKSYKRIKKPLGVFDVAGKDLSDPSTPLTSAKSEAATKNPPRVESPKEFKSVKPLDFDQMVTDGFWSQARRWLPYVAFGFPLFIFFLFGVNHWGPNFKSRFLSAKKSKHDWRKFEEKWKQTIQSKDPKDCYQLATHFLEELCFESMKTKNYFEIQSYLKKTGFSSSDEIVSDLKNLDKIIYGQGAEDNLGRIKSDLYTHLKELYAFVEKGK